MSLTYKGKVTFSDIVPGLNQAASVLTEKSAEVSAFLGDRQKNVSAMQKRTEQLQKEIERASKAAQTAQDTLALANQALEEAKSITSQLANALSQSGIYHYNYVGLVSNMGSSVTAEFASGLPDKLDPTEAVACVLLIAGGDGGTAATVNRIAGLFGQIGGNAQEIINLYTQSVPD
jgi:AAA15 family ATPase/GTPase